MAVEYADKGNDDGTNFGRSDSKIGFYGLTTPITKPALTVTVASASTILTVAAGLTDLNAALASLGLLTTV
jgi:hypothetical protein